MRSTHMCPAAACYYAHHMRHMRAMSRLVLAYNNDCCYTLTILMLGSRMLSRVNQSADVVVQGQVSFRPTFTDSSTQHQQSYNACKHVCTGHLAIKQLQRVLVGLCGRMRQKTQRRTWSDKQEDASIRVLSSRCRCVFISCVRFHQSTRACPPRPCARGVQYEQYEQRPTPLGPIIR